MIIYKFKKDLKKLYNMIFYFELLIFTLTVAYNVHIYSSKEIPRYLKTLIFLCWCLSFIIILILPFDIYYIENLTKVAISRIRVKLLAQNPMACHVLGNSDFMLGLSSDRLRL